jgi:hypothetical protein
MQDQKKATAAERRSENFKKGVDVEASRSKRHETATTLRKERTDIDLARMRERRTDATGLPKEWHVKMEDTPEGLKREIYITTMYTLCAELNLTGPKGAPLEDLPMEQQDRIAALLDQMDDLLRKCYEVVEYFITTGCLLKTVQTLAINIRSPRMLLSALSLINLISPGRRFRENEYLVTAKAPLLLVAWARANDDVVRPLSLDCLSNLCIGSEAVRSAVLAAGTLEVAALAVSQRVSLEAAHSGANCIASIMSTRPLPPPSVCSGALTILLGLVDSSDESFVIAATLGTRAMFFSSDPDALDMALRIVTPAHVCAIARALNNPTGDMSRMRAIRSLVLTALGAIVAKTDEYTPALLDAGLLRTLHHVLLTASAYEAENALLLLGNLMCTNIPAGFMVSCASEAGLFALVQKSLHGMVSAVRRNRALFFVMAALAATDTQLEMLMAHDLIYFIVDGLGVRDTQLTITLMHDFRTIADRMQQIAIRAAGNALDTPNPAVVKAEEHKMPRFLLDAVEESKNRTVVEMAKGLMMAFFCTYDAADDDPKPEDVQSAVPIFQPLTDEQRAAASAEYEAKKSQFFDELRADMASSSSSDTMHQ